MLKSRQLVKEFVSSGVTSLRLLKLTCSESSYSMLISSLVNEKCFEEYMEAIKTSNIKEILSNACLLTKCGDKAASSYIRDALASKWEREINALFHECSLVSRAA